MRRETKDPGHVSLSQLSVHVAGGSVMTGGSPAQWFNLIVHCQTITPVRQA